MSSRWLALALYRHLVFFIKEKEFDELFNHFLSQFTAPQARCSCTLLKRIYRCWTIHILKSIRHKRYINFNFMNMFFALFTITDFVVSLSFLQ